jgi:hypothetical protein
MRKVGALRCAAGAIVLGFAATAGLVGGEISVARVDGEVVAGELQLLTRRAVTLKVADDRTREVAMTDVVRVEFAKSSRGRAEPTGSLLVFANADRLACRPTRTDEEKMMVAWNASPSGPTVSVPLETLKGVVWSLPSGRSPRDQLLRIVADSSVDHDLVIRKNGDRLSGEWLGFAGDAVSLKSSVGEVSVPKDELQAVVFNSKLVSFPKTETLRALLSLTDGSRITVRDWRLDSEAGLVFDAAFGARLSVPLPQVVALQVLGGRAVYLSDMQPAAYQFTPYLSETWDLSRDRNVIGSPLRLRGAEYAKGLGMHSRSEVTYDLNGEYRRFHAIVGIDDDAGGKGSVAYAVAIDGRQVFVNPQVTGESAALAIEHDLANARRLTLSVDFGQSADVRDYANWCDAFLVRK